MDERISGFFNRIVESGPIDIEELSFKLILSNFRYFFLKEFEVSPYYTDLIQKRGNNFQHLHWPPSKEGMDNICIDFNCFPSFEDSMATRRYLADNAEKGAQELANAVKAAGFKEFFRLELPQGCMGALWNPPIRLVWDYFIQIDAIVARFDVIGRV